mgnify:CR=1 FL=1
MVATTTILAKNNGKIAAFIKLCLFSLPPFPLAMQLRCCVCVQSLASQLPRGGDSANDNESLNKVVATAYFCVE